MQRTLLCALSILSIFIGLPACQDGAPLEGNSAGLDRIGELPSVGAMHNEFLELLYAKLESPAYASGRSNRWEAIVTAADFMADKYGIERLSEQQILEAVEQGERLAGTSPDATAAFFLTPEDHSWWQRYASEATVNDARAVFEDHVRRFGALEPGSDLANLTDIAIHSAEFWTAKRGAEGLYFYDPVSQTVGKGWRKILRFSVAVASDGFSGFAASAGAGPVAGAIVGGLASYGSDCLLFGCG
jgi:hypothetical protein